MERLKTLNNLCTIAFLPLFNIIIIIIILIIIIRYC